MAVPGDLGVFDLYRGDAWSLTIGDDDGDDVGGLTDLTAFGDTFTCEIRESEDADPPITVAVDDSDAASGQLVLSLTTDDTTDLTAQMYVGDVEVTGGPVDPLTLYKFRLRVIKDVTHA